MNRAGDPAGGFTLLEMLVALVVFGLLMAGLAQSVRFGLAAWDTQSRLIARGADLDAVERVLRGLLARLEPGRPVDPPNIVGTPASLAFTSNFSETPPLADPGADRAGNADAGAASAKRADMLLRVDAAHRLLLRWAPHRHVRRLVPPAPPVDTVLLEGVERLDLAYWSPETGWSGNWTSRAPPRLIRLRLRFMAASRHWPDIVAAPMRRPIEE